MITDATTPRLVCTGAIAWALTVVLATLAAAPMARAGGEGGGEDTRTRLEQAVHAYYYGSRTETLQRLHQGASQARIRCADVGSVVVVGRLGLPADSAQRVCRRRFAMPTYGSPGTP